jgi:hypothetical protein
MKEALLLVRNIAVTVKQGPWDILFWIDTVWEDFEEVLNPSE